MGTETFGGEIEMFVTDKNGKLSPFNISGLNQTGNIEGGELNYDSCTHLLELNIDVTSSLGELIKKVNHGVTSVIGIVNRGDHSLVNTSTFPTGTYEIAYSNNVRKIVYSLVRGPLTQEEQVLFEKLGGGYNNRNWRHEVSSLFAGIQPWNSVEIKSIEDIFKALFVTSFLAKYISANGPYFEGIATDFSENRWRMYDKNEGMLSTSIYPEDIVMLETFPTLDFSVGNYFNRLFLNSVVSFIGSKKGLLALKNPIKLYELLDEKDVEFVDSKTKNTEVVNNIYDSFTFKDLYESLVFFPDFKLRIVGGENIIGNDLRKLIIAIKSENDEVIKSTFERFGIKFAIEGRNYSTVLPVNGDFSGTNFPFVFQTLVVKNTRKINDFVKDKGYSLELFQRLNLNIYKDGINSIDTSFLLELIDVIFSDLGIYTEEEIKIILNVKEKIISFINGKTNKGLYDKSKFGGDVFGYLSSNLI